MSDHVLTDAELVAAWRGTNGSILATLRAVEQAVLAKCIALTDGSYAHFREGRPVVSEAECRERERKAWDNALIWQNRRNPWQPNGLVTMRPGMIGADNERDRLYPSLLPKPPREVVGPSGMRYRKGLGAAFQTPAPYIVSTHDGNIWSAPSTIPFEDAPTVAALMQEAK